MSMSGYLSLNQCRNTEDLGTNSGCLENQFLNSVIIGSGSGLTRSSSSEEELSVFHPNLGGAGFLYSVNLIDFPEFKDL